MLALIATGLTAESSACIQAMKDSSKNVTYTRLYYQAGDMLNARVYAALARSAAVRFEVECKDSPLSKKQYVNGKISNKAAMAKLREWGLLK